MTSRIAYNNPDGEGRLGLPYHYEILADRRRLEPLRQAIEAAAPGRRVLESGAGSGVLSILAAKAGARRVYAVEKDPAIACWIGKNVAACGCEGVVKVIERDSRSLTLDDLDGEPVDLVIAEHLSTWQVTEPQVSVMNHVNRHLAAKSALHIPQRVFNRVELASSQFRFAEHVELRTHYFVFTGIEAPTLLSEPALFSEIDLGVVNETSIDRTIDVAATIAGTVNSLRLTSPLLLAPGIAFHSSDSLMPPVVVPLPEDLQVRAGDLVRVRFNYCFETAWQLVSCAAWLAATSVSDPSRPPGTIRLPPGAPG